MLLSDCLQRARSMLKDMARWCWPLLLALALVPCCGHAATVEHTFDVGNFSISQLCHPTRVITAVNRRLPGPTIRVHEGDTVVVHVLNNSPHNMTVHWHGLFQRGTQWADGPEMVTQCPIRPGRRYTDRFNATGQEGTLWWHAHSSMLRATVHGAIVIKPKVKTLAYNAAVEVVLQNTALVARESHPMHLHGHNFFVLAQGFGDFDQAAAEKEYNLVNPQERNTLAVLTGGWAVIRFVANNPGMWILHCHFDAHLPIGLAMAFEVQDGPTPETALPSPPADFPQC